MRIRGDRECVECGRQWSYYETGSVRCPDCESLRSVSRNDERHHHTDAPTELTLTTARNLIDDHPTAAVATAAEKAARDYRLDRGFLRGGTLLPLDDIFVAAVELRHAAAGIKRQSAPDEAELEYFYTLLAEADNGGRPPADLVPPAIRWARGLTAATVVEDYCRDISDWLADNPDPTVRSVYDAIGQQGARLAALDGDVSPTHADRLIEATQDLGRYLTGTDETALARAQERLASLE